MQECDFLKAWILCGTIFSIRKNHILLGYGKRTWLKEPSKTLNHTPSYYFPDYFLKNTLSWFEHEHYLELSLEELIASLSATNVFEMQKLNWQNPHKEFFYQTFFDLQSLINQGKLTKAVPFVQETLDVSMHTNQLIKSLLKLLEYAKFNPVHLYGFWAEHEGVLGASPEVLFQCDEWGRLETMACAGTKNSDSDTKTLLSDAKELYEHELVVRGITESLSPYGKVLLGDRHLLNLAYIAHLVTPISIQLTAKISFQDLVKILHPTPAVGAFPKDKGLNWLEKYEKKIPRLRFGAPVGYLLPNQILSSCYVSIRNVQWNLNQMIISAGCGVVSDSKVENEWNEINLKLKAIKEMLAL